MSFLECLIEEYNK
jgi:hypothetical protein